MEKDLTIKIASASYRDILDRNPWAPFNKNRSEDRKNYIERVRKSRFFYRNEPLVSSIIDRIADIGATGILIGKGSLSKSEQQLLAAAAETINNYIRNAIRELLLSGMVYTTVYFDVMDDRELRLLGIQYKKEAIFPKTITFRDPEDIEIASIMAGTETSYYYIIPQRFVDFIRNKGIFPDGTEDKELFKLIKENYPNVIRAVERGEDKVKIYPRYKVILWNAMPDSIYPTPFLSPVLSLLQHKRNIRRMDYAIAARAPLMIMHVRAGNDEYPLTKDDEDILEELQRQVSFPVGTNYYDRIFQLFTNHTVEIDWVTPPIEALLDSDKYRVIDEEILLGLGFPRMLLSGEALRSQASSTDTANIIMQSIVKPIRENLITVVRQILYDIIEKNGFRGRPSFVTFKPVQLASFRYLFEAFRYLYEVRVISRDTLGNMFGVSYDTEIEKITEEEQLFEERGLDKFAPVPYSPQPSKNDGSAVNE